MYRDVLKYNKKAHPDNSEQALIFVTKGTCSVILK
jgi:hypothetical protein